MSGQRIKIFAIKELDILTLLGNWRGLDYVSLPLLKGVPEGYRVRGVAYSISRLAFEIAVEHESFPETPLGCELPRANDGFAADCECVRIRQADEGQGFKKASVFAMAETAGTSLGDGEVNVAMATFDLKQASAKPKQGWEFLGAP